MSRNMFKHLAPFAVYDSADNYRGIPKAIEQVINKLKAAGKELTTIRVSRQADHSFRIIAYNHERDIDGDDNKIEPTR